MFIRAKNLLLAEAKNGQSPIYPGIAVEVDDKVGREFIALGAAVEVPKSAVATAIQAAPANVPDGNTPEDTSAQNSPENDENGISELEGMSFADLKAMAKEMGIDTGKIRSKEGMMNAILVARMEQVENAPVLQVQDVMEE